MAEYIEVARIEDVAPDTAIVARVGDVEVALVNVNGTVFAIDNECTHRGGSLGEGEINTDWSEFAIECPLHGSVFDVRTGEVLKPPAQTAVRTYPVEMDDGLIKVAMG
jgi:3-phenylpropionate/trans-cinnamate dioxygenase ferredoxin subunit